MIQYHNRQWFFLVVHISGIIDKTNDAYTEIEDTFDKEEVEIEKSNEKKPHEVNLYGYRGTQGNIDSTYTVESYSAAHTDSINMMGGTIHKYNNRYRVYKITINPISDDK